MSQEALTVESAFGKTDAEGRYSLALVPGGKRGIVPGEYVVFINWNDPESRTENEPQNPCPYKIPSTAKDGTHRFTVRDDAGKQNVDFELSDFEDRPRKQGGF